MLKRVFLAAFAVIVAGLIFHAKAARAAEAERGILVICDTPEQVTAIIHKLDSVATLQEAIENVNTEAADPIACGVVAAVVIRGEPVSQVKNKAGLWNVGPVQIVAVQLRNGAIARAPPGAMQFTATKVSELGI